MTAPNTPERPEAVDALRTADDVAQMIRLRDTRTPSLNQLREWESTLRALAAHHGAPAVDECDYEGELEVDAEGQPRCPKCHAGLTLQHAKPAQEAGWTPPRMQSVEWAGAQEAAPRGGGEAEWIDVRVADELRKLAKPGERVIWRDAFRWKDDNGVLSNHYEQYSVETLAADFGYEIVENRGCAAIVRKKDAAPPAAQASDTAEEPFVPTGPAYVQVERDGTKTYVEPGRIGWIKRQLGIEQEGK